jgi:hypothetical protein
MHNFIHDDCAHKMIKHASKATKLFAQSRDLFSITMPCVKLKQKAFAAMDISSDKARVWSSRMPSAMSNLKTTIGGMQTTNILYCYRQ